MTDQTEIRPVDAGQMVAADPMVSMIERVVMDPNADLEKQERMLAMKERLDAESARRAFSDAMASCQAEMVPVARNQNNDQTRSKYADLATIYSSCKPICARHGFSFSCFPAQTDKTGMMGVRWTLRHSSGHEESGIAEVPIDDKGLKGTTNKTQTHAFGSTVSYARRYLFCMIFDVATSDDNDGNKAAETVSADQFIELLDLLEVTDTDLDKFVLAFGGVPGTSTLEEFPAASFDKAKQMLLRKKQGAK
jgi:ERF superfamily